MNTFAIQGRCIATPPPADWRDQLAQRLGAKPRRIGTWAELGLYGALRCMADAGETTLPQDAQIWLGSQRGTHAATAAVLDQLRDDLPMPLAFLQTQPSQLLALLAAQLEWKGHACFVAGGDPLGFAASGCCRTPRSAGFCSAGSMTWTADRPTGCACARLRQRQAISLLLLRIRCSRKGIPFCTSMPWACEGALRGRRTLESRGRDDRIKTFFNLPQLVAWPH